jgi:hypothetical protein
MNIFVLDLDPMKSARMLHNKHVVKMCLETAQMLCSAFPKGEAPYKRTHYNHPCTVWSRESEENYKWLLQHGLALCAEYTYRYDRRHKCLDVIEWCLMNYKRLGLPQNGLTRFAQAMPEEFQHPNPVTAYTQYYIGTKLGMSEWGPKRTVPVCFQGV